MRLESNSTATRAQDHNSSSIMASTLQDSTPDSIKATINYFLAPADGGPPDYYEVSTARARRRQYEPHRMRITDLRGREDEFKLDKNGFQLIRYPTKAKTWDNEDRIKADYHPEIEQLMKQTTGATDVYFFSQIVRKWSHQDELEALKNVPDNSMVRIDSPALFAHIDQSYDGAAITIESLLENQPEAQAAILRGLRDKCRRWAIVNAWRPLKPITREPLAVCDASTVAESDLREIILRVRDDYHRPNSPLVVRNQKFWQVAANPEHRWYWPKRQTPEEVLLIKCFDSERDVARRTPHTAIQTPEDHGPPRESIEVRCLLFWEDGGKEEGVKARL